ncbi:MAG: mechanosensitive ion channel family protein [Thermoplasmatota archaeon]
MFRYRARGTAFLILLVGLMFLSTIPISDTDASAKEQEYRDYGTLLDTFNEGTGRYGNLTVGDTAVFVDSVIASNYIEGTVNGELKGETKVWIRSLPGGDPLIFPIDLTDDFKTDAKVRFTVFVSENGEGENKTQVLIPLFDKGDIEILKEGKDNGPVEKDKIVVFGIEITQKFLPENLRTPFVRFLIVFTVWGVCTVLLWFIIWAALKLARRTKTDLDVTFLSIIRGPFFLILLLYGLLISLSQLELDDRIIELLDILYRAGTIILIAYIAIKVFKKVVMVYLRMVSKRTETQADDVLVPVLGKVITVVIWIIAIIYFLKVFGVDVTVFLGAMGIIGLVIAFAAQDTMSNFFSGIMILLDRPFKEGDWIEMEGNVYQVRHIGLRSTRLFHSFSNQVVTIPNNRISDHMFSNLSEPDSYGRKTVKVGVSYGSNPAKVANIMLDVVKSHPDVHEDEEHQTIYRFSDFGDSALMFAVTFWVKDYNDQWRVASEVRERLFKKFEEEGIEIPFPQRVLHFAKDVPPESFKTIRPRGPDGMENLSP